MAWDDGLSKDSIAYKIAAAVEKRVRVIAGPGTGKSFAMKRRVARLLESKVAPKDILAVTFTRVAAEDLHRELQNLGVPGCEELSGQTLHSLAMRLLSRQHILQALVQRKRAGRRILDAMKQKEIKAKSYYDESQLDAESAQKRFALFKLLLNKEDRVALRYLVGAGTPSFRSGPYSRLRAHCEHSGDTPWQALDKLSSGKLVIKNMTTLVKAFEEVSALLVDLAAKEADLAAFVDAIFPADDPDIEELRGLALSLIADSQTTKDLFKAMMEEMTQPDIPPAVEEVRIMSLHKSKGLSSPYVFIAGCVQGVLPQLPKTGTPKAVADAALEEARRLFFVGITRVKANPGNKRPGSLFISYPKEMNAGAASGENIAFHHVVYGQAQLLPSMFIQELGPEAPKPI